MNKLQISGYGSAFYLKQRSDPKYKESYLFLNSIESIKIGSENVSYDTMDILDLINYLGYQPGESHIKWKIDEESGLLFDLCLEYLIPESEKYKVIIQHVNKNSQLGEVFLVDIVNVNGEDVLTRDRSIPSDLFTPDVEI